MTMRKRNTWLAVPCMMLTFSGARAEPLPNCPDDPNVVWSNCQGTVTTPNGSKYVGEFKDDQRNGQGIYIWPDGSKYAGEFSNNEIYGQGILTQPNGVKYIGGFIDTKRDGQGILMFPDGAKYIGEFKDDKFNGQGAYTRTDGTVKEGIWENDQLIKTKEAEPTVLAGVNTQDSLDIVLPVDGKVLHQGSGEILFDFHLIMGDVDIQEYRRVDEFTKKEYISSIKGSCDYAIYLRYLGSEAGYFGMANDRVWFLNIDRNLSIDTHINFSLGSGPYILHPGDEIRLGPLTGGYDNEIDSPTEEQIQILTDETKQRCDPSKISSLALNDSWQTFRFSSGNSMNTQELWGHIKFRMSHQ